jgi:hypothetical protein
MNDRAASPSPGPRPAIIQWPTYALRGWLAALLAQTLQIETQIKYRIEDLETETARLRAQLDRAVPVIESLRQSIRKVDDTLRQRRDTDLATSTTHAPSTPAQAVDDATSLTRSEPAEREAHRETMAEPGPEQPDRRVRGRRKK